MLCAAFNHIFSILYKYSSMTYPSIAIIGSG